MAKNKYVRFSGHLYENLEFEFKPGWETDRVAHMPHQSQKDESGFVVSLLDEKGTTILSVYPEINFDDSCDHSGNEIKYGRVIAYLPLNPKAREVLFRKGDFQIYRRKFSVKSPSVRITKFVHRNGKVSMEWESKPPNSELNYNLTYVVNKERFFTLARNVKVTKGEFDISKYPGSKRARVAIMATDGLKSGFAVSKAFAVKEKPKAVFILKPGPGETFTANQDLTFCGRAHDIAGASLSEELLVWKLNGKVIQRGKCLGVIDKPKSGSHKLTLEAVKDGHVIAKRDVNFKVGKMNAAQKRYFDLLKKVGE